MPKLKCSDVFVQERAAILLRKVAKMQEECRATLCSSRMLSALKPRFSNLQTNAEATIVNLSLEKPKKAKIMRSGAVLLLIEMLKCGSFNESQNHAAGALFSKALEKENRMAIGALGALRPLLHLLRSESEHARHYSAHALYNFTLVYSNRIKLVKLDTVPPLLELVVAGNPMYQVLLILFNLAACAVDRSAMLENDAVKVLVGPLKENPARSESVRENCAAELFVLSYGNFWFRGQLRKAGAVDVLRGVERRGSERAKVKAKRLLEVAGRGTVGWRRISTGKSYWNPTTLVGVSPQSAAPDGLYAIHALRSFKDLSK